MEYDGSHRLPCWCFIRCDDSTWHQCHFDSQNYAGVFFFFSAKRDSPPPPTTHTRQKKKRIRTNLKVITLLRGVVGFYYLQPGNLSQNHVYSRFPFPFPVSVSLSGSLLNLLVQSIGFLGPGLALVFLTKARSPVIASAWLTIAVGLKAFSHCGFLVNLQVLIFSASPLVMFPNTFLILMYLSYSCVNRKLHHNTLASCMVCYLFALCKAIYIHCVFL